MLLGILYAVPIRNVEGVITVTNIPRVYSHGMLNLGLVIKAERLLEFEPILNRALLANQSVTMAG